MSTVSGPPATDQHCLTTALRCVQTDRNGGWHHPAQSTDYPAGLRTVKLTWASRFDENKLEARRAPENLPGNALIPPPVHRQFRRSYWKRPDMFRLHNRDTGLFEHDYANYPDRNKPSQAFVNKTRGTVKEDKVRSQISHRLFQHVKITLRPASDAAVSRNFATGHWPFVWIFCW